MYMYTYIERERQRWIHTPIHMYMHLDSVRVEEQAPQKMLK